MSSGIPLNSSPRVVAFTTAELNDVDGVKQSVGTETTPQSYSGAQLDGAAVDDGIFVKLARTVTVTSSVATGAYDTNDPIVVTGRRGGSVITEELQLTDADGGETIRGVLAFDRIDSIDVPAQTLDTGALEFGVGDVCGPDGDKLCRRIKPLGDGFVRLRQDLDGELDESIPVTTLAGFEDIAPLRILTDQALPSPTNVGLVIYV